MHSPGTNTPLFSIIVPMYNRAGQIRRALDSCISQSDRDFEAIVTDDASTDDSVAIVKSYVDPRIQLERHPVNRGACAARNTAVAAARGEWLVFLDSDDELTPNALETIRRRINEAGSGVSKLLMSCRYTDGSVSPDPALPLEVWGYEEYVAWCAAMVGKRSEAMPVTRRSAFQVVPYDDGHAPEALHELSFVKKFNVYACPDVVRIYHQDATLRVVRPTIAWLRANGAEFGDAIDRLIDAHGEVLDRHASAMLQDYRRGAAYYHFFAGNRARGLKRIAEAIRAEPFVLKSWMFAALGLVGPFAMSLAKRVSAG